MVDAILAEEPAAAEKIAARWDEAIDASLAQVVPGATSAGRSTKRQ